MSGPLRLVTIPFSHYCEKARWILERSGLEFEERGFLPILHIGGTMPLGGRSVPVLRAGDRSFTDSTDIALYVDSIVGEATRLYPGDETNRKEAVDLEDAFDRRLGPHSRRWIYFHVLAERRRALEFMRPFASAAEFRAMALAYPVFVTMMKRAMRIDAESARRSLGYVREVFDSVSGRLSDGRKFLLGDRITIADITFASLAAPVVYPPQYGGPNLPRLGEVPPELAPEVDSFRKTRAGQFVLRMYDEQRSASALPH